MFAILRTDERELDFSALAKELAAAMGRNTMEVLEQISTSPGLLFTDLDEAASDACLEVLQTHQIGAERIPSSEIADVPKIIRIDSCTLSSDGIAYEVRGQSQVLAWDDIGWVDLIYQAEFSYESSSKQFLYDAHESMRPNFEAESGRLDHPDFSVVGSQSPGTMRTGWLPLMEIIAPSRGIRLQCDLQDFNFRATGQRVHPSRQENIWALSIGIVNAASHAHCGPGVAWIRTGDLPQRQRIESGNTYERLLAARLTRHLRAGEPEGVRPAPEDLADKMTELVNLGTAILADGKVSLDEIKELLRWLRAHRNVELPAVKSLTKMMVEITADKVIDAQERKELKQLLTRMVQGDL